MKPILCFFVFIFAFLPGFIMGEEVKKSGNSYINKTVGFEISKPNHWEFIELKDLSRFESAPPLSIKAKKLLNEKSEKLKNKDLLLMEPLFLEKIINDTQGLKANVQIGLLSKENLELPPSYLVLSLLYKRSIIAEEFKHTKLIEKTTHLGFPVWRTQYSFVSISKNKNFENVHLVNYWMVFREKDYFQIFFIAPQDYYKKLQPEFDKIWRSIKISK